MLAVDKVQISEIDLRTRNIRSRPISEQENKFPLLLFTIGPRDLEDTNSTLRETTMKEKQKPDPVGIKHFACWEDAT